MAMVSVSMARSSVAAAAVAPTWLTAAYLREGDTAGPAGAAEGPLPTL